MNIIFNSLLAQLVKYDVHTTRKIKIDTRYFLSHIVIFLPCHSTRLLHSLLIEIPFDDTQLIFHTYFR